MLELFFILSIFTNSSKYWECDHYSRLQMYKTNSYKRKLLLFIIVVETQVSQQLGHLDMNSSGVCSIPIVMIVFFPGVG